MERDQTFKTCQVCGVSWPTRASFLSDRGLEIVGYQAHFEELTEGLFLFNHSCKTTLAIKADCFRDLYSGPVFSLRTTGGPQCPGFCVRKGELRRCDAPCECAYIREIIQIISAWPK